MTSEGIGVQDPDVPRDAGTSTAVARHASRLSDAVVVGVGTALLPPARMPAGLRRGLQLGVAATSGIAAYVVIGARAEREDGGDPDAPDAEPTTPPSRGTRLALAAGIGLLAGTSSIVGLELDAALERALVRRGVRRPRLWVGAAAAVVTGLLGLADRSGAAEARRGDEQSSTTPMGA